LLKKNPAYGMFCMLGQVWDVGCWSPS